MDCHHQPHFLRKGIVFLQPKLWTLRVGPGGRRVASGNPWLWQSYAKSRTDWLFDSTSEDDLVGSVISIKPKKNLDNAWRILSKSLKKRMYLSFYYLPLPLKHLIRENNKKQNMFGSHVLIFLWNVYEWPHVLQTLLPSCLSPEILCSGELPQSLL